MNSEAYWENLVKRSLCRFLLLWQLAEGPLHGYAINQAIKGVCQGCCEPTEAMVYSTLKELLEHGYVESRMEEHHGRRRRVCWLTAMGKEAFQCAARVWERMLPVVQDCLAHALYPETSRPPQIKRCDCLADNGNLRRKEDK